MCRAGKSKKTDSSSDSSQSNEGSRAQNGPAHERSPAQPSLTQPSTSQPSTSQSSSSGVPSQPSIGFGVLSDAMAALRADREWDAYKKRYKRAYTDDVEEAARYKQFQESKARVAKLNELDGREVFEVNEQADRYENEKTSTKSRSK